MRVVAACVALVVAVKLPFLLSAEALTGWDTPGQRHLAALAAEWLAMGHVLGDDPTWFGGWPAFTFYPPLFHLGVAALDLMPGVGADRAFNLGAFAVIVLLGVAWAAWVARLLEDEEPVTRGVLAGAVALFALSFPGDGHQGVAIAGALGGTLPAVLGQALAVFALERLEALRRAPSRRGVAAFVLVAGLVFYAHLLSAVFLTLLVGLWLLLEREELSGRAIAAVALGPALVAWPVLVTYLAHADLAAGAGSVERFPALLSVFGLDAWIRVGEAGFSARAWAAELLLRGRWVPLLFISLWGVSLARQLGRAERDPARRYLLLAGLLLLWLTTDETAGTALSGPGVHWYRAFGLLHGVIGLGAALELSDLLRRAPLMARRWAAGAIAAGAASMLFTYDFIGAGGQSSLVWREAGPAGLAEEVEALLAPESVGAVVLVEELANTALLGSPHGLDPLLRAAGLRSALGLTMESSPSGRLLWAWTGGVLPDAFRWGIDDRWDRGLWAGAPSSASAAAGDFLRRAGIGYVLARSGSAVAWLSSRPAEFSTCGSAGPLRLFGVLGAGPPVERLIGGPVGFVTRAGLEGRPPSGDALNGGFLVRAGQVRLRLDAAPPMVNLDRLDAAGRAGLWHSLSGLVVYDTDGLGDPAGLESLLPPGLPLVLVNVDERGAPPAVHVRTREDRPVVAAGLGRGPGLPIPWVGSAGRIEAGAGTRTPGCTLVRRSWFPRWVADGGAAVLQTDTNQMLVCGGAQVVLRYRAPLSRPMLGMVILTLVGAVTLSRRSRTGR